VTSALREWAPGKVNLCLFIGPTRASDGRHELVSVMQSVTLADELVLEPAPGGATGDEVVCPGIEGENLALLALRAFRQATGWDAPPQRLTITKRVPVAAGMGGGSGDAAAALRLAARAAGFDDTRLLHRLAAGLGADVPAQVVPGRALATGAGEDVRALPPSPPLGVLVLPGDRPLSTAAVYGELDRRGLARDAEDLAARRAELEASLEAGEEPPDVNDLEPVARALDEGIDPALEAARRSGADAAMVSGSGPTVVGLFRGENGPARARAAAAALSGAGRRATAAEAVTSWR
jgi:4-diphosphocytidyl-2-C-methyl-D-erythritol kinase